MAKQSIKPKPTGFKLEMRTFTGKSGQTYLVMRDPKGSYHVFAEVQAKEAARDWGAEEGTTRQMWNSLWKSSE